MSEQFKVGDICVGQNFVLATHLNGMEAEIVGSLAARGGIDCATGEWVETEVYEVAWANGEFSLQEPFYLRRPPAATGEQSILAMFDAPPVERRQPATAWQAQYDTAQALMQMGVRVRPGKWPVEVES